MSKKINGIISLLLIVVLLTGCGTKSSNATSGTSSQNIQNEQADVFSDMDFAIEGLSVRDEHSFFHTRLKIRNNSNHYINNMKIHYQILDKSNDVIDEGDYYVSDLDAGVAITVEAQETVADGDFSKVAAYKFVNFEVREYDDTKLNKEFRFNPAIVVDVKDFDTYSK